jgi:hypothetical protein
MRRAAFAVLAIGLALGLSSCIFEAFGFAHDQPLAGPYRLVAVDEREQMIVCRSLEGGDCVGDGLPGRTVFAAGADERYLVIARHPSVFAEPLNRSVTEYYVVERSPDEADLRSRPEVLGPFDQEEFEERVRQLSLPEFTIVFDDLR